MPSPFDHLDSFKKLDPEVQSKINERFSTLSPEDQNKIMSKVNTPMESRGFDEPIKDISITPLTKGEFQKTGEDVSAHMMTKGMINASIDPYLAATVGTTIAMIPHVAAAMIGPKGAKKTVEGAEMAGKALAESSIGQAIKGTGKAEVARLTEKAAELPLKQTAKSNLAQETLQVAKKGIQTTEEKLGLGMDQMDLGSQFEKIVSNKQQLSAFANKASKMADMGVDKLSEMNPSNLQTMRKIAQEGLKKGGENLNDLSRVQLSKAKKVFTEALEMAKPEIKDALSKYKDIQKVINDLPAKFKEEKQTLQLALVKARNLARKQAPIRKGAAIVAGGALAATGAYEARKLIKGE